MIPPSKPSAPAQRILDPTVVLSIALDGVVVVRLAHPVANQPDGVSVHSTLVVTPGPHPTREQAVVERRFDVTGDGVALGDWMVDVSRVHPRRVIERSQLLLPSPWPDPATEPTILARRIVDVWERRDLGPEEPLAPPLVDLLTSWTRTALLEPIARFTVVRSTDTTETTDIFVAPSVAIETTETGAGLLISYLPPDDLPLRLWERCGIGRLLSLGRPTWCDQAVELRATHLSEHGLVLGGLAWEESSSEMLRTPTGTMTPLGLASEVLRLVPGGDAVARATERASKDHGETQEVSDGA